MIEIFQLLLICLTLWQVGRLVGGPYVGPWSAAASAPAVLAQSSVAQSSVAQSSVAQSSVAQSSVMPQLATSAQRGARSLRRACWHLAAGAVSGRRRRHSNQAADRLPFSAVVAGSIGRRMEPTSKRQADQAFRSAELAQSLSWR